MTPKLLIATRNPGKLKEFKVLLKDLGYEIVSPAEAGVSANVEETGLTFEENARLKATTLAKRSGLLTLADDSGLEVDALGGKPGVFSARYGGAEKTDRQRNELLLKQLEGVPESKRTARFRCVIAIATPDGIVNTCSGECEGLIAFAPAGHYNFGYDPLFLIPELGKTMAQLTTETKNSYSHRSKAILKAMTLLGRQ